MCGFRSAKQLHNQIRPNKSRRAGNQNGLAFDELVHFIVVNFYFVPAQQVGNVYVTQLADADFALYQLVNAGKCLQFAAGFLTDVQDGGLTKIKDQQKQQQDQQIAVQEFIEYMNSSNASSTESATRLLMLFFITILSTITSM